MRRHEMERAGGRVYYICTARKASCIESEGRTRLYYSCHSELVFGRTDVVPSNFPSSASNGLAPEPRNLTAAACLSPPYSHLPTRLYKGKDPAPQDSRRSLVDSGRSRIQQFTAKIIHLAHRGRGLSSIHKQYSPPSYKPKVRALSTQPAPAAVESTQTTGWEHPMTKYNHRTCLPSVEIPSRHSSTARLDLSKVSHFSSSPQKSSPIYLVHNPSYNSIRPFAFCLSPFHSPRLGIRSGSLLCHLCVVLGI